VIRLDGVSCERGDRTVLEGVSLSVAEGEVLVVHGGRGSGKSVLCAVAAARDVPARGTVWVASRNLGDLQRASLPFVRRNIGYLTPLLLDDESGLENVMLAVAVRGEAISATGLEAARVLAALGLEACCDRPVATLSAGERQLVALARALAGTPPAVVLDEPTAGLDAEDRARVADVVAATAAQGAAVLCATADEAFAQALAAGGAHRVRLSSGRLAGGSSGSALISLAPRATAQASSPAGTAGQPIGAPTGVPAGRARGG